MVSAWGLKSKPHRSLGWVLPWRIDDFSYASEKGDWDDKFQVVQLHFWGSPLEKLERIPYTFYVSFRCDPSCHSHRL